MKHDPLPTIDDLDMEDLDELLYLDEQYESSTELAAQFVDDEILPLVEAFDYNNPDQDYVPGCASFGLFARLVSSLMDAGFTVEELKQCVDDFSCADSVGETLH